MSVDDDGICKVCKEMRLTAITLASAARTAGEDTIDGVEGEHSIHRVRVRTSSRTVTLPWETAQDFVARCIAAYPTIHRVVEHFRAVGVSRPVELADPNDRTFVLAVIEAWAAQVGEDELPPGIRELGDALRGDAT